MHGLLAAWCRVARTKGEVGLHGRLPILMAFGSGGGSDRFNSSSPVTGPTTQEILVAGRPQ